MNSKAVRIVLDVIASVVVFFVLAILLAWILGAIFGSTKDADGQDVGNYNSGILLAIDFVITVVFAVWFSKLLGRNNKEVGKNVGE